MENDAVNVASTCRTSLDHELVQGGGSVSGTANKNIEINVQATATLHDVGTMDETCQSQDAKMTPLPSTAATAENSVTVVGSVGDPLSNAINKYLSDESPYQSHDTQQIVKGSTEDGKAECDVKNDDEKAADEVAMVTEMELSEIGMDAVWEEKDLEFVEAGRSINFSQEPALIGQASQEFNAVGGNFLKGCKWSPDGLCILTNSEDQTLRLFNLPPEAYEKPAGEESRREEGDQQKELESVLKIQEGELIYDYCWYPKMNSYQPETCCLASCSRDHPVHLWDAFTGKLRGTYKPMDAADELTTPHSLGFSENGRRLYCGFNKAIRIFYTDRPGTQCEVVATKKKTMSGQTGIISCFAMAPELKLYAAGSYSKSIGLYTADNNTLMCLLEGQTGGVTHLRFSSDKNRLYSGGRKDQEILCWDIRNPGNVLYSALREVSTHQRIYFDLDSEGRYLVSGNRNGSVTVWDTSQTPTPPLDDHSDPILLPAHKYKAHTDCVNGISLHPHMPIMATTSGQRLQPFPGRGSLASGDSDSESDQEMDIVQPVDHSLKIWSLRGNTTVR